MPPLFAFGLASFCLVSYVLCLVFVLELADGAFSYAAVPRVGLGPTTPP